MSAFSIERTVAIIKPCAIQHRFSILRRILSAGLHILQERCVKLSIAQVEDFFRHMRNDKNEWALNEMEWSSGPLIALCLSHNDAIELWKKLMGPENCQAAKESAPTSIRAMHDCEENPVYGSKCSTSAQLDMQFFFPSIPTDFFPTTTSEISAYLCSTIYHSLTDALHEMLKIKSDDPIKFIADYMLEHNSNQPLMHTTCPNALLLMQQIKEDENKKEMERDHRQRSEKKKCGCSSISTASSLSSF